MLKIILSFLLVLSLVQPACVPALDDPSLYAEVPDFEFLSLKPFELDLQRMNKNSKISSQNALLADYKLNAVQKLLRASTEESISLFRSTLSERFILENQKTYTHTFQEDGIVNQVTVLATRVGQDVKWLMKVSTVGSEETTAMQGFSSMQGGILEWTFYTNTTEGNKKTAHVKKEGEMWKLTFKDSRKSGKTTSVEILENGDTNWLGFKRDFQTFELTVAKDQRGELIQLQKRKCWDHTLHNIICR